MKGDGRLISMGAIAGMRSVAALAVAARVLEGRPPRGRWARLGSPAAVRLTTVVAASELVADKFLTRARIAPLPLAARVISGALGGAALSAAQRRPLARGVVLGAVAALAGAVGLFHARRRLSVLTGFPQQVAGMVEDALVVTLGARVVKR